MKKSQWKYYDNLVLLLTGYISVADRLHFESAFTFLATGWILLCIEKDFYYFLLEKFFQNGLWMKIGATLPFVVGIFKSSTL